MFMVDSKIFLGLVMPNQYCHIVNIKLVSGVAFLGKKPLTPDPYIQYNFTIWQISLMTNLQVCANKISRILAAYYFSKELLSMDLYVEVPSLQEWCTCNINLPFSGMQSTMYLPSSHWHSYSPMLSPDDSTWPAGQEVRFKWKYETSFCDYTKMMISYIKCDWLYEKGSYSWSQLHTFGIP